MSDDRFKQARRSLIDRNNQRQQQDWDDSFDDDDFEDEATAMVNLGDQPAFAPPPNFAGDEDSFPDDDARTEMISLDQDFGLPGGGAPQMRSHSGIQPSYDRFGGGQPEPEPMQQQQHFQPQPPQQQTYSPPATSPATPIQPGAAAPPLDDGFGDNFGGGDPNQSLVIGGGAGTDFEENTAFININSFAAGGEHFTPDDQAAGYEGSTQFVNIAALQASGPAGATPVEHDAILKQTYTFGPQSIQQGEVTLIFAQNQAGQPVVLKRVWEGDPNGMPIPVRQRIAALDQVRHPQLAGLNGMIAAPSGAWVELARPPGFRLTEILTNNGPQSPETAMAWIEGVASVLAQIHAQAFVYANLTTDAIWIQDDGSVMLEPFDVLAYEMRGNLGAFGPPELNLPADQQQRTPATDVYSLAAVTVATLTGIPLNLGAVETLDKSLQNAVFAALNQDPTQRPQDAMAFIAASKGKRSKGGAAKGGFDKKKLLLPIVAVVMLATLGIAYVVTQPGEAPPPPIDPNAMAGADPNVTNAGTAGAGVTNNGTAGAAAGDTVAAEAQPPSGDIEVDPRLTIESSFATNPPATDEGQPSDQDREAAAGLREEAREMVADVKNLQASARRDRYVSALNKLAEAARLSGGMTQADNELFEELSENSLVSEIRKDYFDRVDDSMKEERISRVKQIYPQLAAVDASATEMNFFVKNKSVEIKPIEPVEIEE